MKDIKVEDLLKLLEETEKLKEYDKPIDDFYSFLKEVTPGRYKINLIILREKYKEEKQVDIPKNFRDIFKNLGFSITYSKKNISIGVSKKDKERLTLEYATKISEKVYKKK